MQIGQVSVDWSKPERYEAKFRINRFLNSVEVFSRDKEGLNIPVLIIQLLYALADGKFGLSEARMELLNAYRARYMNDPGTLRSYYFVQLLALIPAVDFDAEQLQRRCRKNYELLVQTPWGNGECQPRSRDHSV